MVLRLVLLTLSCVDAAGGRALFLYCTHDAKESLVRKLRTDFRERAVLQG